MHPALVVILGILGTGATGWAAWVSKTLIDISVSVSGIVTTQDDHNERIAELERLLPRHIPSH
jgi:hypothetical protein